MPPSSSIFRFARLVSGVVAAATLAISTAGDAQALDEADGAAGRAVIERQLDALRSDDAAGAFALAAPSIQGMFGSEDAFMAMVRQGYRPIYRPRRHGFGPARDVPEGFEQALDVQDEQGVDWDAVYTLQRQPDGSWRISGCRLVKRPGEAV